MAVVKPFRGWRYASDSFKNLADVVVPPYDVISSQELARMKEASPYNFTHIILPEGKDKHQHAADLLHDWQKGKKIVQDTNPSFYFYKQTFELKPQETFCQPQVKNAKHLSRTGIICRVGLEEYGAKKILPHEKTFSGPKADRYQLMTATQGNMEPVFLGYDSPRFGGDEFDSVASKANPVAHFKDSAGVEHALWEVTDAKNVQDLESAVADKRFYILDGHHRYETGLSYFRDHRARDKRASLGFVLANICAFRQPGTIILPTHRVVRGLQGIPSEKIFEVLEKKWDVGRRLTLNQVEQVLLLNNSAAFGLRVAGEQGYAVVSQKTPTQKSVRNDDRLDLEILHWDILPDLAALRGKAFEESEIGYIKDIADLEKQVDANEFQAGFLVRPSTTEEVMRTAEAGKVMPHKSTFFFPKIPSGLVINIFD